MSGLYDMIHPEAGGEDVVIAPAIQDAQELETKFPKGFEVVRPYLRITPQPNK